MVISKSTVDGKLLSSGMLQSSMRHMDLASNGFDAIFADFCILKLRAVRSIDRQAFALTAQNIVD